MKKGFYVLFAVLFLLISCGYGYAADFSVSDEIGFQDALTTAESNGEDDVITLDAGTYLTSSDSFTYEAIDSNEGNLTIKAGEAGVYIDGQTLNPGLNVDIFNGDLTIEGITFQNCSSDYGAGAYLESQWGDIAIENCNFVANQVTEEGGGLYAFVVYNGIITMNSNTFSGNSAVSDGGGAYIEHDEHGELIVSENVFDNNSSTGDGGGFYCEVDEVGKIDLIDNEFRNNQGYEGGAANLYLDYTNDVTVTGNFFEDNTSENDGGGLYLDGPYVGDLQFHNNIFRQNIALNGDGGAFYCEYDDSANIFLTSNDFTGNTANYIGGAVYMDMDDHANMLIEDNNFEGNVSSNDYGGALYVDLYYGPIFLMDNTFDANTSYSEGGGAYTYLEYGEIYLKQNIFSDNTCTDESGGGLYTYISSSGNLTLDSNNFTGNTAPGDYGGGAYLYCNEGNIYVLNNLVANNSSLYDGGGIYVDSSWNQYVDIINNTIVENSISFAGDTGGGIFLDCDDYSVISMYNNIIRGNTSSAGDDDLFIYEGDSQNYYYIYNNNFSVISYDIVPSSFITSGDNMDVDPLFVSATDFRLQEGSPVIDMGNSNAPSLPEVDLDGNARISGAAVDMGAYEFTPEVVGDDDDDDNDTIKTSGGGGGCSTGIFVPSMLLLIAPLLLLVRKR